jgi:hypothetical protein
VCVGDVQGGASVCDTSITSVTNRPLGCQVPALVLQVPDHLGKAVVPRDITQAGGAPRYGADAEHERRFKVEPYFLSYLWDFYLRT